MQANKFLLEPKFIVPLLLRASPVARSTRALKLAIKGVA